ncbi:hypothetical protein PHYBOEH_011524 [Phytophthora boehmeriae]|uniref:Myosin-like protein n=1 Tax=Phytophthora boehmeriae TaxID=109152 RepID=A0A8T1WY77_9STRA|nr:hypothetical protein PHYBOEH_011524 [Phytophthora boehmeriae]
MADDKPSDSVPTDTEEELNADGTPQFYDPGTRQRSERRRESGKVTPQFYDPGTSVMDEQEYDNDTAAPRSYDPGTLQKDEQYQRDRVKVAPQFYDPGTRLKDQQFRDGGKAAPRFYDPEPPLNGDRNKEGEVRLEDSAQSEVESAHCDEDADNEAASEVSQEISRPPFGLHFDQIPLDVDDEDDDEDDAVTEANWESSCAESAMQNGGSEVPDDEDCNSRIESNHDGIDELLPPLLSTPVTPKTPVKGSKLKVKSQTVELPPVVVFETHPLLEYARTHFNLTAPRASLFQKPVDFDLGKRLVWERKLISTTLTRLSKEQAPVAVQAFRNISGFMGNRASGKGQIDHCFKLLRNVVPRSQAVKDEIYCQLCKQLTRNPSANAVMNGWLLMNACLVTFPPSPPLAECLERFISLHVGISGESEASTAISAYAMDALASLKCCATKGERKEIPSAAELRALQRHALNDIPVMLADASIVVMQVSAWTTSRDLAGLVARKLGVCHERAFALVEINDDGEELLVPDNERIMDLYAEWERTHIDVTDLKQMKNKKKNASATKIDATASAMKTSKREGYYLLYKAYLWVHVDDETAADVGLYYLQAVRNVLDGRYVCDLGIAIELAGYQLYCKLGNIEAPKLADITNEIHEYIPRPLLSPSNRAAIAERVLTTYDAFVNNWRVQSTQQAKLAYLRLCKRQPFYGLTLFDVKNSRQRAVLPSRVILAINDKGIGILGADSDEVLAMFPYADVSSWGYSANSFVFIVARGSEENEYSFRTTQGKNINDIVFAYVDYIISLTANAGE